MKNKTFINEIFVIRAIACLSVVLVHSITMTVAIYNLPQVTVDVFRAIQMMLMFATPTFILISELLVAFSYPSGTPKGFLVKRLKYIFIPYVVMGTVYTFYTFIGIPLTVEGFAEKWVSIVVKGQWHGYFILIIFQFYILHIIFAKYLNRVSPKIILPITFLVNIAYLGYFNFVTPTGINGFYIWYDLSRLPFLGWIFYFALAYYCGINLIGFKRIIDRFKLPILFFTAILAGTVIVSYHTSFITMVWSNRVDVMIYTVLMMLSLYYLASKVKEVPKVIYWISHCSLGIYLLHPLFHKILVKISYEMPYINMGLYLFLAFSIGVFGSVSITVILNKITIGKYIVGKLGSNPKKKVKPVLQEVEGQQLA